MSVRRLKRFLRWAVWGATLFFIGRALQLNWTEVTAIDLSARSWCLLAVAWGLTMIAHSWAGWVWHWLLQSWGFSFGGRWAMQAYWLTNVAKYLPGNVWHFYGRLRAVQIAGGSFGRAVASVVAEPLVMAVAALGVGALASTVSAGLSLEPAWAASGLAIPEIAKQGRPGFDSSLFSNLNWMDFALGQGPWWPLGLLGLWSLTLVLLHPRWLNPQLEKMSRIKLKGLKPAQLSQLRWSRRTPLPVGLGEGGLASNGGPPLSGDRSAWTLSPSAPAAEAGQRIVEDVGGEASLTLTHYPLKPLLGEMAFVLWRSLGFIVTVAALTTVSWGDLPVMVSAFSLAWLLGLVVPGAPGGIGVFEACAIALLGDQFSPALILASVACYRLVNTLAEATGAGVVWVCNRDMAAL